MPDTQHDPTATDELDRLTREARRWKVVATELARRVRELNHRLARLDAKR